ncbi:hypothetical protein IFO70_06695 [Phormidium tenue FACHB-886]|nr:hypothetical protein [Phormidium tenue FACHB-886]
MTPYGNERSVWLRGSHKLAVFFVVATCLSSGGLGSQATAAPLTSAAAVRSSSIQPMPSNIATAVIATVVPPERPLFTETQSTVNISANSGLYRGAVQLLFAGLIAWIIVLLRGSK